MGRSARVSATVPVVGVAGKACAGKDLVVGRLVTHGFREINVDHVGHEALTACASAIVARFGPDVANAEGGIDRRALGRIVFSDRRELHALEAIVHPWMRERVADRVAELTGRSAAPGAPGGDTPARDASDATIRGVVINAAILVPLGLHPLCTHVVLVRAPLLARVRRARRRDTLPWPTLLRRLWVQRRLDAQVKATRTDTSSVDNRADVASLHRAVDAFVARIEG